MRRRVPARLRRHLPPQGARAGCEGARRGRRRRRGCPRERRPASAQLSSAQLGRRAPRTARETKAPARLGPALPCPSFPSPRRFRQPGAASERAASAREVAGLKRLHHVRGRRLREPAEEIQAGVSRGAERWKDIIDHKIHV